MNAVNVPYDSHTLPQERVATKQRLVIERSQWRTPLLYMLTLALMGLNFIPAVALLPIFWMQAWRNDRNQLAIQLLFFFCGMGLVPLSNSFGHPFYDIALFAGPVFAVLLRKNKLEWRALIAFCLFFGALLFIARFSTERMSVQVLGMRKFLGFISVFVFIAAFAGKRFFMRSFCHTLMVYVLLMCAFYILDAYVIKGQLLLPGCYSSEPSTFLSPAIHPFTLAPYRKYPAGIVFLMTAILPIVRYYRLAWWQWALILGGFMATQTMTVIAAFGVCLVFFQGSARRIFQICLASLIGLISLVALDYVLPMRDEVSSALRIRSTIEQFMDLRKMVDDEDLAQFASGRMGQVLPKVELIGLYNKEWTGLGFIHDTKTTSSTLMVENEYYTDVEQALEVATAVEIAQVQAYINVGFAGLILIGLFYGFLFWNIRRSPYKPMFAAAIVFTFVSGLGGFSSLTSIEGTIMIGFIYAIIILADKKGEEHFDA